MKILLLVECQDRHDGSRVIQQGPILSLLITTIL